MNSELEFLKNEVVTIRKRIAKAERRIAAGKNPESEEERMNKLSHILGKKQERVNLILSGKEC